jgi:methionyl-tRNA formyltransferase
LRKEDLQIDWSQPARRVVDQIRSLAPAPTARTPAPAPAIRANAEPMARTDELDLETIKVLAAHVGSDEEAGGWTMSPLGVNLTTGRQASAFGRAGDGRVVVLDRVVPPGRAAMSGEAYARSAAERIAKMML